jgi:hypothetical protein
MPAATAISAGAGPDPEDDQASLSDLQQRDKNVVVSESLASADAGRASPGMRPA